MSVTTDHLYRPVQTVLLGKLQQIVPPGRLGQYIGVVALTALVVIGYAFNQAPLQHGEVVLALFVLSFFAESTPISLKGTPLQGSNLSVSAAMAFAAVLMLGPAAAIVVNFGSALAYILKGQRPLYKRVLTTAALANSAAAAGAVYLLAGGQVPLSFGAYNLIAAGLAAGTYFLVNSTLISEAISLATQRPFQSVLATWQWLFLQMFASLAVGLIMALAYAGGANVIGFLLVSMLLLLPWYSTYAYVQKSRMVSVQQDQLKRANSDLTQANHALDLRVAGLRMLHSIGVSLNSAQRLPEILSQILRSAVSLTKSDAAAIFLFDESGENLSIAGQIGLSADYLETPETVFNGATISGLREGRTLVVDPNHPMPSLFSEAAVREGIQTAACLPLSVSGVTAGGLDICFKSPHTLTSDELDLLSALAQQAAVALQNARLVEKVHEGYLSTIHALAAAVDAKDPYTRGHSEAVRQLAVATGRQLRLSPSEIELLSISALFHDIGKIGISETILNKPGFLTAEERSVMSQHPVIGENILSKVPALTEVSAIVRRHHERFDRTGYPDGVCARDNLLAAIVSVCDAYQAMTSDRTYRKAMSHAAALAELRSGSGRQFVPEVVDAFIAMLDYGNLGQYKTEQLSAELVYQNPPSAEASKRSSPTIVVA
jgi:putative nucleotidyltransferase with HDIG domain